MLPARLTDPLLPLADEVQRTSTLGFAAVEVMLAAPCAWPVSGADLAAIVAACNLPAVAHLPAALPIASPYPAVRHAAQAAVRGATVAAAEAGITIVGIHPDTASLPRQRTLAVCSANAEAIAAMQREAAAIGVTLAVENTPEFGGAEELDTILDAAPGAGLLLDIGHANLHRDGFRATLGDLLQRLGSRLVHVHAHDNDGPGGADRHLPPGRGTVDWPFAIAALRDAGYDGVVTLEAFTGVDDVLDVRDDWIARWDAR